MPKCQNCGSHVSERYVRVQEPEGVDGARVCPHCPDMVRANGKIREKRSGGGEGAASDGLEEVNDAV